MINESGNVGIGTTSPSARLSLGSATNGERITWSNTSNIFSEYSSGDLWLSSNFYGNLGTSGYVTSVTENFGAAGISVSATGGGLNGVIKFFVDNAASKTAGASFTPTERMRITGGGRVGIGTTSPGYPLVIDNLFTDAGTLSSGGNFYGVAYFGNGGLTIGYQTTTNHIALMANTTSRDILFGGWNGSTNVERMRITSGGVVCLNTTSIRTTGYTTNPSGHYASEMLNFGGAQYFTNVNNAEGSYLVLGKSRGTSVNSVTAVQNGDILGGLIFQGTTGTQTIVGAGIFGNVDGTVTTSNVPSAITFFTSVSGASLSERMRITSAGEACIGRTTAYGAGFLLNVQGNIYASAGIVTGAPSGESSATWKLGDTRTGTCVPSTWGEFSSWFTGTVANIEINGTTYTIPVVNAGYC
jgi:hypothetical protein